MFFRARPKTFPNFLGAAHRDSRALTRGEVWHTRARHGRRGRSNKREACARWCEGVVSLPYTRNGSLVVFSRKKAGSARAKQVDVPGDAPEADAASGWCEDGRTHERGALTHGALRRHLGDASFSASPSSRSALSVDSAESTPSRARSDSTDRWRRGALETCSARKLAEETREAHEVAVLEL
jgi:hypothetical protein